MGVPVVAPAGIDPPEDIRERARRAANDRQVRLFKSYREAELCGFYSIKRLKQMGLFVSDFMRPYFTCQVETKYGDFAVYSKEQCGGKAPWETQNAADQESVSYSIPINSSTPSPSSPPFDVQNIPSDVIRKELRMRSRRSPTQVVLRGLGI